MDWSYKQVYIEKKNVPTYSYIRKKVVEHGASICEEITPSTDIMLVPVLYQLEKNVHDMYGMDVVGYKLGR